MATTRPFAYNTCSIDDNNCDTISVTYQLNPSCETISVTYTLIGEEPVTVEVEALPFLVHGKKAYSLSEFSLSIVWDSSLLWRFGTEDIFQATLSEDTPCPFGVFTILEGSFEAFEVNPITIPDPVTVEVGSGGLFEGKNFYEIAELEYFTIFWNKNTPSEWELDTGTENNPHLNEDTECPFGTYTIEEGSIFSAFSVGCVPVPIPGTEQVGDLAIGFPTSGFEASGVQWWNGPDEELGYVISKPIPSNTQPTPIFDSTGHMTFSTTYKGGDIVLSNSNQTALQQFGYIQSVLAETLINTNSRVMFSISLSLANPPALPGSHFVGIGRKSMDFQGSPPFGNQAFPGNDNNSMGYCSDGTIWYNGNVYASGYTLLPFGDGDIIDVVINTNTGGMWVRVNGGDWNNDPAQDPVANPSLGIEIINAPFYPVLCPGYEGTMTIQNTSTYGVPDGYTLLGTNGMASVGFYRTGFNDNEFVNLANSLLGSSYTSATESSEALTNNGYWNSYTTFSPVLSLDAADYTSGDWIDSIGGKSFVLYNSPTWSPSNGGHFNFDTSLSQSAICDTSLPSMSTWTVGVWHYYTGTETGAGPCIVTETFIGGGINYSLGKNLAPFSVGFFNGGWRITDGYSLTPNNWYYIVGTYDGSTIKLYVNNTLVDSTNYTGTPTSSGAGIRLMERWDLSDYWGGKLATVDIYDKSLSNSEIESIWNLTKSRFGL